MKFDAIIEARMNSSRLPGKILTKINNKPSIEILINRLSRTPSLNNMNQDQTRDIMKKIQKVVLQS